MHKLVKELINIYFNHRARKNGLYLLISIMKKIWS